METRTFYTKIRDGKPICGGEIRCLLTAMEGKEVEITIAEQSRKRSYRQEKFYRKMILPAVRNFENESRGKQFSLDQIHLYIKAKIIGRTEMVELPDGSWHEEIISNADKRNTTVSWEKEMEMIRAHYAPKGLMLPLPNEAVYV